MDAAVATIVTESSGDILASLRAFAQSLGQGSWFAACGERLTAGDNAEAASYVAALGLPGTAVAGVATWPEAAALLQRPDWSRAWWEAEAAAQQEMKRRAEGRVPAGPLLAALGEVAEAAASLLGAASLAMSRVGIADPALARVAAGAVAQACHQHALALAAGARPEHLFAIKYRLFAAGRWPLGVVGDRCFVF